MRCTVKLPVRRGKVDYLTRRAITFLNRKRTSQCRSSISSPCTFHSAPMSCHCLIQVLETDASYSFVDRVSRRILRERSAPYRLRDRIDASLSPSIYPLTVPTLNPTLQATKAILTTSRTHHLSRQSSHRLLDRSKRTRSAKSEREGSDEEIQPNIGAPTTTTSLTTRLKLTIRATMSLRM